MNAASPCYHFFEIVGDVMIRVTHMVMLYAPIGVFGLISFTVSRHGLAVLLPLGALILTAFLATVVFVGMILLPLVRIATGIPDHDRSSRASSNRGSSPSRPARPPPPFRPT